MNKQYICNGCKQNMDELDNFISSVYSAMLDINPDLDKGKVNYVECCACGEQVNVLFTKEVEVA